MQGLLLLVICLVSVVAGTLQAINTNITISSHCQSHCGDLIVPYPFGIGIGIGTNCSLNSQFDITCNTMSSPPEAFIQDSDLLVLNISDTQLRIENNGIAWKCYNSSSYMLSNHTAWYDLNGLPYTFSESNKLTLIGCNDLAVMQGADNFKSVFTGCLSVCLNASNVVGGKCSGVGCCQTSIPKGLKYFETEPDYWMDKHNYVRDFNPCSYAFLAEGNTFCFRGLTDFANFSTLIISWLMYPLFLIGQLGNKTAVKSKKIHDLVCKSNSDCVDSSIDSNGEYSNGGYRCKCKEGFWSIHT